MKDRDIKLKKNVRYTSIRKKTASRICSTQVLYGASFVNDNIDHIISSYLENYLSSILKELGLQKIDFKLFESIIKGVHDNIKKIDEIISSKLSKNWSIDRLNETEKSVLRLATYELLFAKKFKKLTIINEYISIIEVFGGNKDFANGILDNISQEFDKKLK